MATEKIHNKILLSLSKLSLSELSDKIKTMKTSILLTLKKNLDDKYYNEGTSPFSDAQYDILKSYIQTKIKLSDTGAPVKGQNKKVKLPFWLGSADKITPENKDTLERWLKKNKSNEYVVTAKLDGVSCLYEFDPDKGIKLYTRGD